MKKQRTFYIDLVLAAICLLTLITGLIIHAAGHGIVQSNVKSGKFSYISKVHTVIFCKPMIYIPTCFY